jgi:hypothetical protein
MTESVKVSSKHWTQGYLCLPNNFGSDIKSLAAFKVMFRISGFHYVDEKELSLTYLSKIAGVAKSTAYVALKELVRLGYIKKTRESHKAGRVSAAYKILRKFAMAQVVVGSDDMTPVGVELGDQSPNRGCSIIEQGVFDNRTKEINIKRNKKIDRTPKVNLAGLAPKDLERNDARSMIDRFIKKFNEEARRHSIKRLDVNKYNFQKLSDALKALDLSDEEQGCYIDKAFSNKYFRGQNKGNSLRQAYWMLQRRNYEKMMQGFYDERKTEEAKGNELQEIKSAMIRLGANGYTQIQKVLSPAAFKAVNGIWCQLFRLSEWEATKMIGQRLAAIV